MDKPLDLSNRDREEKDATSGDRGGAIKQSGRTPPVGAPVRPLGWYAAFIVLATVAFVVFDTLTGVDAIGGSVRFAFKVALVAWNAVVIAGTGLLKIVAGSVAPVAKGMGWRRLSRISTSILNIGLVYGGSVLLSDRSVRRAKGWIGNARKVLMALRERWLHLHLAWKLIIVAALIASQLYLHWLLILFPIAFLVPVLRKLWTQIADLMLGSWYWRKFGSRHRALVKFLSKLFGVGQLVAAIRLIRLRYLCAWRLWRHDPRYRRPGKSRRVISLVEPIRLWRRAELDRYVGRPLLAGRRRI